MTLPDGTRLLIDARKLEKPGTVDESEPTVPAAPVRLDDGGGRHKKQYAPRPYKAAPPRRRSDPSHSPS